MRYKLKDHDNKCECKHCEEIRINHNNLIFREFKEISKLIDILKEENEKIVNNSKKSRRRQL